MAATPPPHSTIQTPPTPLHGAAYDTYEPYPIRYSTRSANRRSSREAHSTSPPALKSRERGKSSRQNKSRTSSHAHSPPHSTQTSPGKNSARNTKLTPQISSFDNARDEFAPTAPVSHELSHSRPTIFNPAATMAEGMLPTPVKTPRKKPVANGNVNAAARVLFQNHPPAVEDAAPAPKRTKKGRKYNGFSLTEDGSDGKIEIFTDSRDKVPEMDENEDNPFLDKPTNGESSSMKVIGSRKRRKLSNEVKRNEEVEEAIKRDDGMVYVFRGKKIFRKFKDDDDEDVDDEGLLAYTRGTLDTPTSTRLRPLTRSSIKPRLLFPTEEQRQAREVKAHVTDEEATTDIDEAQIDDDKPMEEEAEAGDKEEAPATPIKGTCFTTPASPPASVRRSLRSKDKKDSLAVDDHTPSERTITVAKAAKRVSPFDGWGRTKAGSSSTAADAGSKNSTAAKGKKREAQDVIERSGGVVSKKTRGH